MSQTTVILIFVAIIVVAAIALFVLRPRPDAVAVTADANDDPALSASGEAMIVGDVMPIDSNEPTILPGAALPPGAVQPPDKPRTESTRKPAQVYEARRQPDPSSRDAGRQAGRSPDQPDPAQCQSELVEDCATQPDIRWAKRFEPQDGAFDDATRLSLIRDLGIVRAPWGVPLLTQAYEEEPAIDHRRAALRALAAYRHPDTQPTFELALRADDEESRAIAANALTALSIRAALPS